MKSFLYSGLIFIVVTFFFSCSRQEKMERSEVPVRLVVDIVSPETKVTDEGYSAGDENTVSSLQVFVFKGDALDGYGSSESSVVTVSCTSGERTVYAVANAGDLSGIGTMTELSLAVSLLGTSVSALQMVGSDTVTVEDGSNIHIELSRLAARVVLKAIKFSMESAQLTVKSVYLTNVAGDCLLGGSGGTEYEVQNWYNKRGYVAGDPVSLFYDVVSEGTVGSGETLQQEHRFYAYPNGNAYAVGEPWSPRSTQLVICGEISGETYYYVVNLPALFSNHSYVIELVNITRLGNTDDQETVIEGMVQPFSASPAGWSESAIYDEGVVTI